MHPRGAVRCRVQKGVNVLQGRNSLSVQHSHKPARLWQRPSKLAARRRSLAWLRGLVAFLVFTGGLTGSQDSRVALVTSSVRAAESPGFPQEPSRRQPQQGPGPTETAPPVLSQKQKKDLLKDNFEKMKRDADELADLAKSLQEDLNKSNQNVFSLGVVDKAGKIEKLAKRIKGTARGY